MLFFNPFPASPYVNAGRQLLYIATRIAAVGSVDGIVGSMGCRQSADARRKSDNLQIVDIPKVCQPFAARIVAVETDAHVVGHVARQVNGELYIPATLRLSIGTKRIIGQAVEQCSPCCPAVAAYIHIVELRIVRRIFVGSRCP